MKIFFYAIVVLFTLPTIAFSQDLESDLLDAETGSRGNNLGVEVINITQENKTTTVEVKIPVDDLENYQAIVVIENEASPKAPKIIQSPEWLVGDNSEEYGLRFKVKGLSKFQFKIQLLDHDK